MNRLIVLLLSFVLLASIPSLAVGNQAEVPSGPLVISETWPQATDLVSWTQDVMRLEHLENAPET
jgi:hypothetical protein